MQFCSIAGYVGVVKDLKIIVIRHSLAQLNIHFLAAMIQAAYQYAGEMFVCLQVLSQVDTPFLIRMTVAMVDSNNF